MPHYQHRSLHSPTAVTSVYPHRFSCAITMRTTTGLSSANNIGPHSNTRPPSLLLADVGETSALCVPPAVLLVEPTKQKRSPRWLGDKFFTPPLLLLLWPQLAPTLRWLQLLESPTPPPRLTPAFLPPAAAAGGTTIDSWPPLLLPLPLPLLALPVLALLLPPAPKESAPSSALNAAEAWSKH